MTDPASRNRSDFSATRRRFLGTSLAAAGAFTGGSLLTFLPAGAQDLYTCRMQLGWLASNGILGEIAADEKGFYAEEGLKLEIVPGGPNVDGIASVASGSANLGSYSSSPSLMLARSAGMPIKCIAAGYQRHPFTYFSMKSKPVAKPEDMIGKKVATNGTARVLLQALLAANGLKEDQLEISVMGSDVAPLLTGQVDVVTGWRTNTPVLVALGDDRVELTLWDAGVQLYANPYYTTDDMLANHKDKVVAMMRASARGWAWAFENRKEAVEMLVKRYPNMVLADELATVDMLMDEYCFNEQTKANGWGQMTRENWQKQIEQYAALGQFQGPVPSVDDIMTLEILEATADVRAKFGA
ncbi:ABC transporter substrate-binding protein [Falsigemmobacter intermedius]|uniref:Thiamine pyrimidine synthase n=1 Tax=Falsigemmobacter intermedius TaxID=1553448 RepID=A0A3S4XSW5_9RHOB|nr:ABC transporter substrate-binding protein [Falsigemmobacter intermedius]RWY41605.1 ABC transporter substrate-binding protein [Falsigemmobacter intermedius]